jgi:hypothetical protein
MRFGLGVLRRVLSDAERVDETDGERYRSIEEDDVDELADRAGVHRGAGDVSVDGSGDVESARVVVASGRLANV